MSVIDEVLKANAAYAQSHAPRHASPVPKRGLVVLTCMDTRLEKRTLGLMTGEAHMLRNAGGIVTEDVVRSLVISHHLLGTKEVMVINHTDCGLMKKNEEELRKLIVTRVGIDDARPYSFYSFTNIDENVRQQLHKLRSHPLLPRDFQSRGFVYDLQTGLLREVQC